MFCFADFCSGSFFFRISVVGWLGWRNTVGCRTDAWTDGLVRGGKFLCILDRSLLKCGIFSI